jgi:hypothetical protein
VRAIHFHEYFRFTEMMIDKYMKKGTRELPPHVYNIAHGALTRFRLGRLRSWLVRVERMPRDYCDPLLNNLTILLSAITLSASAWSRVV